MCSLAGGVASGLALPLCAIAPLLSFASDPLGALAAKIAGDG